MKAPPRPAGLEAQWPASQALHCKASCSLHAVPLVGVPPGHMHWFVAQPKLDVPVALHVPVRCCPAGHDARHVAQPKSDVPVVVQAPVMYCPAGHDARQARHS